MSKHTQPVSMAITQSSSDHQPSAWHMGRYLGWRFFTGIDRGSLSFISAVSLLGLSLAIALLILVLSVMNGFEKEFRDRILGLVPHATLWFDPEDPAAESAAVEAQIAAIEQRPEVLHVQPFVELRAMAIVGNQVNPLLIQGVDTERMGRLLDRYLVDSLDNAASRQTMARLQLQSGEIAVGAQLAKNLNVQLGQRIRIMVPDTHRVQNTTLDEAKSTVTSAASEGAGVTAMPRAATKTRAWSFVVKQVVATGTEIDNLLALVSIRDAARLKGRCNPCLSSSGESVAVDGVQLQFTDVFAAHELAREIAIDQQWRVRMSDWTQTFGNLYTAIQLSRQLVVLLLATIIAVAVFNVFVTLGMVVRQKRAEIAILRTMGLSRRGVMLSFMMQGMNIALLGCVLGTLLGCIAASIAPMAVNFLQALFAVEFLQTDVYPINYLPSQIVLNDLLLINAAALSMSLVATLYPAWRASQVMPAVALTHH